MHTPEGTARPGRLPEPSRIEETAAAMAAVGDATDEDLAAWTPEKLGRADHLLAGLERTATAWDTEPRAEIGDKLWRTNHRFLTDSRALRARLRPHQPQPLPRHDGPGPASGPSKGPSSAGFR